MSSYPCRSLAISDLLWAKTWEIRTIHFISQSTLELLLFRVRCCEYSPELLEIIVRPSRVLDSDRLIVTFCGFCVYTWAVQKVSSHVIWKTEIFISKKIQDTRNTGHQICAIGRLSHLLIWCFAKKHGHLYKSQIYYYIFILNITLSCFYWFIYTE